VAVNSEKNPLFSVPERVKLIKEASRHLANVTVDYFDGLTVNYVQSKGANVVIRGLRAISDFESELQMALMNKRLNERVETMFMMTSAEHLFLSSKLVKQLVEFGESVTGLVPRCVEDILVGKMSQIKREAKK